MIFKEHLNLISASVNVVLTKFGYLVRPVTKHKVFMNMDDFWLNLNLSRQNLTAFVLFSEKEPSPIPSGRMCAYY